MPFDIKSYRSFIFDCDGVILDSNQIKTDAFYELALPHGESIAQALVDYHREHGGFSRFQKVAYLYQVLLKTPEAESDIAAGLKRFGEIVHGKLLTCPLTMGCEVFLKALPRGSFRAVVSGGLETEIQDVFRQRGLDRYFDEICGSPRTKDEILADMRARDIILDPAVFLGDSRYDMDVAARFGLDPLFVCRYSEFDDARSFIRERDISSVDHLGILGGRI